MTGTHAFRCLLSLLFVPALAACVQGQLPIRNLLHKGQEEIVQRLEKEDLIVDVWDDGLTEEEGWIEIELYNYSTSNNALFYVHNDSCYSIHYNFYDDEFVLGGLRRLLDGHADFTPCDNLADCWVQNREGEESSYWNLFEEYEGDENWDLLIIDTAANFEKDRWWYELMTGK